MRIPKLLAPVNSFESAVRVIRAGADEIYLGVGLPGGLKWFVLYRGPGTGGRGPTYDELGWIVDFAHKNNVKVILVVNEPFMSETLERPMREHIRMCLDKGIDALIIGDIGVLSIVKDIGVDIPLYASTYFVSMNSEAVDFLREQGFSRVILERHLTIQEISEIVKQSKVDIEVFCHSGGCSNINGSCYFYHWGFQKFKRAIRKLKVFTSPCTIPFEVYDWADPEKKIGISPILDALTICSICHLSALVETGVAGLKLVGRLEDVTTQEASTRVYRKLLDLIGDSQLRHDKLKKMIKSSRQEFEEVYSPLMAPLTFSEACCRPKRCIFSPLLNAPYKVPVRA